MTWLEPRSVIVISSVLAIVTLLILISLRRSVPRSIQGLAEWMTAYAAFIVAVTLLVSRSVLHPLFGVVVANALIIMAILLFGLGLRRFYGGPSSLRPLALGAVVVFASQLLVTLIIGSYPLRLALVTSSLLCVYAYAYWQLQRHASGTFGERVMQGALLLPATGVAVRLLTVGEVGPDSQLFMPSMVQSIYLSSLGAGALLGGVGFILMINERMRTELERLAFNLERTTQELRQQNEVKSKFLAYAGHDIRQPLQAMHLLLAGLLESGLNASQQKTARMMELSVNALTDLLNALLDISKLEAGAIQPKLRPVELDIVLARLVQEFMPQARAKGLQLRLRLPKQVPLVQTDEQLLASVLRNLLGNAIKYTQRGGVLVAVRRAAAGWKLQVWDTGIGIAEEHLTHVFEEYYQVDNPQRDRSKGLGLGLAIVQRMAALLDLNLHCRSRVGQGTVMEITLAASNGLGADTADAGAAAGKLDLQRARVVVVEDDAAVAQALGQWLQAQGAVVEHYTSAEDALAAPDLATADVYLSDYRLPGRLTGIDFLETLRSRAQDDIPGVLLTGDTSSQFIEQVAASGWLILFKPVHPRDLQAVLKLLQASARDGTSAVQPRPQS